MTELKPFFQHPVEDKKDQKERDSHFVIIYVRGMEDLSPGVNDFLSEKLNVISFSPDWKNKENNKNFKESLTDFHQTVEEFAKNGQEVVVIGASAGAGLALAHLLKYPESNAIRMLYSLNGVINPQKNVQDPDYLKLMNALVNPNPKFAEMVNFLSENLTEKSIKELKLSEKIVAYTSRDQDGIVPTEVTSPLWLRNIKKLALPHAIAIFATLVGDINKRLKPARSNRMR